MKKPKKPKKPKKRPTAKPCKAWALIDPKDPHILPHWIFDERVRNSGRGSVSEGYICIRVEVKEIRR